MITNDQATGDSLVLSTEANLTSMGYSITNPYTSSAVPEIDAASGTSAINAGKKGYPVFAWIIFQGLRVNSSQKPNIVFVFTPCYPLFP